MLRKAGVEHNSTVVLATLLDAFGMSAQLALVHIGATMVPFDPANPGAPRRRRRRRPPLAPAARRDGAMVCDARSCSACLRVD